jgi:hypothetical protein
MTPRLAIARLVSVIDQLHVQPGSQNQSAVVDPRDLLRYRRDRVTEARAWARETDDAVTATSRPRIMETDEPTSVRQGGRRWQP